MLKVIRNAVVEPKINIDAKSGFFYLTILINGEFTHDFPVAASESKMCSAVDIDTIRSLFTGGTYVIFDGVLVDYRRSDYRGFIHSDSAIDELSERIGVEQTRDRKPANESSAFFSHHRARRTNGVFLGGERDKFALNIKELGFGGNFENKLIYRWSPFSSNITTCVEVLRLVCSNGMMAMSPLVTNEVPLINDWERSLSVISTQLQPQFNDLLRSRFIQMTNERASVYDISKANDLIFERSNKENISREDAINLDRLGELTRVKNHLGRYYNDSVFEDKDLAKRADGDLTLFDVYNILTEASTHYGRNDESDMQIQRQINRIVFDSLEKKTTLKPEVPLSQDSDHRRAFFGDDK